MKQKILFVCAALLAPSFFFMSCNKDLPVFKKGSTDSSKTVTLINAAKVSTIVSDYFQGVVTDKSGNIYALKNTGTSTIYKVSASGQETAFYTPPAPTAQDTSTNTLNCLATDSLGNVYTVSTNNFTQLQSVLKIGPDGSVITFIANLTQYVSNVNHYLSKIMVDKDGNLYFAGYDGIHEVKPDATSALLVPGVGVNGFAIDKSGNVIYPVTNGTTHTTTIEKMTPQGTQSNIGLPTTNFYNVTDIAADAFGDIYISTLAETLNSIYVINTAGEQFTLISTPYGHADGPLATAKIYGPFYLSTDASGSLYFFDTSGPWNYIRKITF